MSKEIIYYYCKSSVFENIIKNKEIWLCDIRKSNDYAEISGIMDEIFDELEKRIYKDEYLNSLILTGYDNIMHFIKKYWNETVIQDYLWLAMCFTKAEDDLSMWRGYTDNGNGFAIGFDKDALVNAVKKVEYKNSKIADVKYSFDEHQQYVLQATEKLINSLKEIESEKKHDINISIKSKIKEWYTHSLLEIAYFKKSSFSVEQEVRLCYFRRVIPFDIKHKKEKTSLNYFDYDIKKNDLVACLKLHMPENLISKIVIGPMNKATPTDVERFLACYGIFDVKCVKSQNTYKGN
ncbi:MAG: DUF2971 domain-containing protein [Clostridia bacterium]|nr:DUF2971 domain-containing protein [Clostridia bacterium]